MLFDSEMKTGALCNIKTIFRVEKTSFNWKKLDERRLRECVDLFGFIIYRTFNPVLWILVTGKDINKYITPTTTDKTYNIIRRNIHLQMADWAIPMTNENHNTGNK